LTATLYTHAIAWLVDVPQRHDPDNISSTSLPSGERTKNFIAKNFKAPKVTFSLNKTTPIYMTFSLTIDI